MASNQVPRKAWKQRAGVDTNKEISGWRKNQLSVLTKQQLQKVDPLVWMKLDQGLPLG
jgi:hypothetical protein